MPLRFINPNYHVLLIHYPLGVFMLGVVLELLSFLWRRSSIRIAAKWMIVLGALATFPAATSGLYALIDVKNHQGIGPRYEMLRWHVLLMSGASILAVFCAVVGIGSSDAWRKKLYFPLLLGVMIAAGLNVAGAWRGGETIYTQGTAVAAFKPEMAPTTAPSAVAVATTGDKVDFQTQIQPILSDSCYKCHDEKKQSGDLRLDTPANIRKGGKDAGSKVVVAGDPGKSDLYSRITTQDHDDLMPPPKKSKRLSPEKVELIRLWISQGADFGSALVAAPVVSVDKGTAAPSTDDGTPVIHRLSDVKNLSYKDVVDYYIGGALQMHLIVAGLAFAFAMGALGVSYRKMNLSTAPLRSASAESASGTDDLAMHQSIKPGTQIVTPAPKVPAGRLWLLTALIIFVTAAVGYWTMNGQESRGQETWNAFVHKISAVRHWPPTRYVAHTILGGAFLLLALILGFIATAMPKSRNLLSLFGGLLVAVIAMQIWVGVLMGFYGHNGSALGLHPATTVTDSTTEPESTDSTAPSSVTPTPVTPAPEPTPVTPAQPTHTPSPAPAEPAHQPNIFDFGNTPDSSPHPAPPPPSPSPKPDSVTTVAPAPMPAATPTPPATASPSVDPAPKPDPGKPAATAAPMPNPVTPTATPAAAPSADATSTSAPAPSADPAPNPNPVKPPDATSAPPPAAAPSADATPSPASTPPSESAPKPDVPNPAPAQASTSAPTAPPDSGPKPDAAKPDPGPGPAPAPSTDTAPSPAPAPSSDSAPKPDSTPAPAPSADSSPAPAPSSLADSAPSPAAGSEPKPADSK